MTQIFGYKQNKFIPNISVDNNVELTKYAWLCVLYARIAP